MSHHDPTLADDSAFETTDQELSVDDVARMQRETPETEQQSTPAPVDRPAPVPIHPSLSRKRPVSGRYRARLGNFEIELRVDVDRVRPLKRVSGDFFLTTGSTKSYFGSFVVHAPAITVAPDLVTIEGIGDYTYAIGAPKLRITIPRVIVLNPPAPATLRFFTLANAPGATYLCRFESAFFRTLQIETDRMSDVTSAVFASYQTGTLPSPPPHRNLSVSGAFVEAGIDVQVSPAANVIDITHAGNGVWSNAELHASMVQHFSLFKDEPQFKVWEVVAQNHDLHFQNIGLLGIMFDQFGRQRQGCAVFYRLMAGTSPETLRRQLYTYVHELGHCFNLLHSWQKSLAQPPGVDRPGALSWMNYPQFFTPGGEPAFWNGFPFQFDTEELVHVRHAFRNHVIMGGSNFAVNSALEDPERFNRPIEDHSGLELQIAAPRSFMLGEPVAVDLKLSAIDSRGRDVTPYLHPNLALVDVAIQRPGGQITVYRPAIEHCVEPRLVRLEAGHPISETAYIGYGKDGLYFDAPGLYKLRASYTAPDGSQIVSDPIELRVRNPITAADDEIAELYLGEEQGMLFYLAGSDSPALKNGNEALDLVLDKYGDRPLAVYARLQKGFNLGREFKTIEPNRAAVSIRRPATEESHELLAGIVAARTDEIAARTAVYETAMATLGTSARKREVATAGASGERRPRGART
jgi:hypothetical protein